MTCGLTFVQEQVAKNEQAMDQIVRVQVKTCPEDKCAVLRSGLRIEFRKLANKVELSFARKPEVAFVQSLGRKDVFYDVAVVDAAVQAGDAGRRQLGEHISDASTTASNFESMRSIDGKWDQLAGATLALSRISHLRRLSAAPASARALLSRERRIDVLSIDDDDEDEGARIASTVPFLPTQLASLKVDGQEEEVLEDSTFEEFAETHAECLCEDQVKSIDVKRILAKFERQGVSEGDVRSSALEEGKLVLKDLLAARGAPECAS